MNRIRSGRRWLRLAACGCLLAGCSAPEEGQPATYSGELRAFTADYPDRTSKTLYQLATEDGQVLDVVLQPGVEVPTQARVTLSGVRQGRSIVAESLELTDDIWGRLRRGVNALPPSDAPRAASVHKTAWLIADQAYTVEQARNRLLHDADGAKQFYGENSWNEWQIEGDAYGPYNAGSGCKTAEVMAALKTAAADAGVDLSDTENFIAYLPVSANCPWQGFASVGGVPAQGGNTEGDVWLVGQDGCVILNQELGHNYGLLHAHSCGWEGDGCSNASEYGDGYTPMGGGCGHLHAIEKGLMSFFNDGCNTITVAGGSATVEIAPISEACEGPLTVRVKSGDGFVYAEYRKKGAAKSDTVSETGVYLHFGPDYAGNNVETYAIPQGDKQYFTSGSSSIPGSDIQFTIVGGVGGDTVKLEVTDGSTGSASVTCLDGSIAPSTFTCDGGTTGGSGGGGAGGAGGSAGASGSGGEAGASGDGGAGGGGSGGDVGGAGGVDGGEGGAGEGGAGEGGGAGETGGEGGHVDGGEGGHDSGTGGSSGEGGGSGSGGKGGDHDAGPTHAEPEVTEEGCSIGAGGAQGAPPHGVLASFGLLFGLLAARRRAPNKPA